jgi:protein TonB
LAPLNPILESWKQRAAERIYEINRKSLFEGRPEHLLRAVIVVELTVDREGKVTSSKIMRSPGIGELNTAALRSLRAASPLPAPPPSLLVRNAVVYQETWLFRKDGRFQLRSLAQPQE